MSARDTLIGIVRQWTERHGGAPETPEAVVGASDAELLREWAAKIREVGTAKGWSVWAAAFMDPDVAFVDTAMPSTETIVSELRRLDRVATLREAADDIETLLARREAEERDRHGFLDHETELQGGAVRDVIAHLRTRANEAEKDTRSPQPHGVEPTPDAEPLIVSRYDTAIEAAPEEEPVLTVGAVAEDGRPVALCFDPETRAKVAGWLAPGGDGEGEPASDFFQPDHTYQRGRWTFQCLAVAPAPWNGEVRAVGYLSRQDGTGTVHGMLPDDWAHGGWTNVTEDTPAEAERPVSVGQTYWRVAEPTVRVKVTRVWQKDDQDEPRIAFDIFGRDWQGRPCTAHSALRLSLFRELYRYDTTVPQPERGGEG